MNRRRFNENKSTGGKSAGVFYTAIIFSLILLSILVTTIIQLSTKNSNYQSTNWYQYISYGISTVAIIVTIIFSLKVTGLSFKDCSSKFSIDGKFVLIVALLFLGMIFGLSKVNEGLIWIFQKWGYKPPEINITQLNIVMVILIVAVLPAIFEELIFRGFILNGLKNQGGVKAVLYSAVMFALYHMSPAQTAYQFIVGALFALIAIKAKSVLPTMILHFMNNAFIILNEFYFHMQLQLAVDIVFTILGLACVAVAVFLLIKTKINDGENKSVIPDNIVKSSSRKYEEKQEEISLNELKRTDEKHFFIYALPGIVASLVMWFSSFF